MGEGQRGPPDFTDMDKRTEAEINNQLLPPHIHTDFGVIYTYRGVSGWWAGWAIAHPDFGRIEGAAGKCRRRAHRIMYYLPTHI